MGHFSRLGTLTVIVSGVLFTPLAFSATVDLYPESNSTEMLLPNSSQGYLGVGVRDVDNDRAAVLKLKDPHGAEITSIDQDAPAAKSGLKIHDVVIQMNGQRIEGIEQFRRMLRETPPGRTASLVVMRDGQAVNISVQLADRSVIATQIIGGLESEPSLVVPENSSPPVLPGGGGHGSSGSNSFFGSLSRNRYYVGVDIQPLPTGLADYFGAKSGVLVGNVFPNSPAAVAGLKAADVIQKVNGQPIVTLSDWERAIRVNHGKQVQVTIIRDRKELTLNMVAGAGKNASGLLIPETNLPDGQMLTELRGSIEGTDTAALAGQIRESMKGLDAQQLLEEAKKSADTLIDAKEIEKEMEQSRELLKENGQQIQQQMQILKQALQFEQMD
jgi:serine protease Do